MIEKRIAVLVGAAEYEAAFWSNLHYVRDDIEGVEGLRSVLERDLGACCFSPSDIYSRLGAFSHRENMAFLRTIAHDDQFTRDTLLFLYFSGHGFIDKEVGNVPCLIMHNTKTDDPSGQGITFKWIRDEIIRKSKATIFLVIDSCFSGQIISHFDWSEEVVGDHFAIFASCAQDQESFGDPYGTQSYFTNQLIKALRGHGLALENGIVDTNSAARFLQAQSFGPNQFPQFRLPQTPILLSVPQCSISAPTQESFDDTVLQKYLKRIRQVGASNQLLTSDTLFVRSHCNVGIPTYDDAGAGGNHRVLSHQDDISAMTHLTEWANQPGAPFCLLLGDTGLGKTSLLRRFHFDLCGQRQTGEYNRHPFFFDLRMYLDVRLSHTARLPNRVFDDESFRRFRSILIDWLQNEEGVPILWNTFQDKIKRGELILIVDGLDEMCRDGKFETIVACLSLLSSLCPENSKVVLSCRTHFFQSDRKMLDAFLTSSFPIKNFPIVHLRQFGEHEIKQFLDWHLTTAEQGKWKDFESTRSLGIRELSRRPFLLELLVIHLQRNEKTSPCAVFEHLLEGWIARDNWRFEQFLQDFAEAIDRDLVSLAAEIPVKSEIAKSTDRKSLVRSIPYPEKTVAWSEEVLTRFIELLAVELRFEGNETTTSIDVDKLPDRIKHYFPSLPEIFIDFFEYCIRTCSFLSRGPDGNYSFVNDSVQAFFAARYIHKELLQDKYRWDKGPDRGASQIPTIPHKMGRTVLDEYLIEFLSDMISPADETRLLNLVTDRNTLSRIKCNPHTLFYLSGNALSLLARLYKKLATSRTLPKLLQDRNISGADLSFCNLQQTNFSDSIMKGVNLQGANLTNANLNRVQLIDADLRGADLTGVKINGGAVVQLRSNPEAIGFLNAPKEFRTAAQETGKSPDRQYKHPSIAGLTELVKIPGGKFFMGTNSDSAEPRERPQHEVWIDPFSIEVYPVTNTQFAQFIQANPEWGKEAVIDRLKNIYYLKLWNGNNLPREMDEFPVVYVSWYAAEAYAKWAGRRLPTEAEWEFALRDGKHEQLFHFPWGEPRSPIPPEYAKAVMDRQLQPVGMAAPPSSYGLFDMTGNVNEWVFDWFGEGYFEECRKCAETEHPVKNPQGPAFGREKVLRGGSFLDEPTRDYKPFACFHRAFLFPQNTNQDGGFRCAK